MSMADSHQAISGSGNSGGSEFSGHPEISIVVPFYHHEAYAADTLDSIIAQDYRPIQIVCGDDASNDRTPEILQDYAARYPDLIDLSLNDSNMGVTPHFNKLLNRCRGEFIAFLGGDDLMLPGKLTKQVELMDKSPEIVLSYTNAEVFDSDSGEVLSLHNTPGANPPKEGNGKQLLNGNFICGSTSMLRTSAVPGGGFNPEIPVASDWLFFAEVGLQGEIGFIDQPLSRYRRHSGNVTRSVDLQLAEEVTTLNILEQKYPDHQSDIKLGRAHLEARIAHQHEMTGNFRAAARTMAKAHHLGLPRNLYSSLYAIDPRIVNSLRQIKNALSGRKAHWSQS